MVHVKINVVWDIIMSLIPVNLVPPIVFHVRAHRIVHNVSQER